MDIEKNISALETRMKELETERTRLSGMLDVMQTIKNLGVKIIEPQLKDDAPPVNEVSGTI